MRIDSPKPEHSSRARSWRIRDCLTASVVMTILAFACGNSTQPASTAPTQMPETSSPSAPLASGASASDFKSRQPQPPIPGRRESASVTATLPLPAISAPAAASSAPASPYGPPSLDEIIFQTDVIAIVRPISSEPGTLTVQEEEGQTIYSPVVQSRYEVVEYLKGDGDSEIIVNANNFTTAWVSAEQALENAERDLAAQDSKLDGGEGIVFIRSTRYPDEVSDISRKEDGTGWRQYNAQAGLFSAAEGVGAISTSSTVSVAGAAQHEGYSIANLRERVDEMEALLKEGEGIEGYEQCIEANLRFENFRRKNEEFLNVVADVATFQSGMPADFVVHEFSTTYPRQWFTDDNASLFHYGDNEITATRPIPAGAYEVNAHFQEAEWMPCDYVAPPTTWRYTFESAMGVLHEAFFDPAAVGEGVGANAENGQLQPVSFETGDSEIVIERIEWRDGRVEMKLSPTTSLVNYRLDFIALDGSVALRLDFDATPPRLKKAALPRSPGACVTSPSRRATC